MGKHIDFTNNRKVRIDITNKQMEKILFDIKAENDDISSSSESYSNSIVSVTNL